MRNLEFARQERLEWDRVRSTLPKGSSMQEILALRLGRPAEDIQLRSNLLKMGSLTAMQDLWAAVDADEVSLKRACQIARQRKSGKAKTRKTSTPGAKTSEAPTYAKIKVELQALAAELDQTRETYHRRIEHLSEALEKTLSRQDPTTVPFPVDAEIQQILRRTRDSLYAELKAVGNLNADWPNLGPLVQRFLIEVDDALRDLGKDLDRARNTKAGHRRLLRSKVVVDLPLAFKALELPFHDLSEVPDFRVVKSAYRQLAKTLHPDRTGQTQASTSFLRVQKAYELISSEFERRKGAST